MFSPWRRKAYSPLVRRQRAAARKALYGGLALMSLAAFAGKKYLARPLLAEQPWMRVDWAAKPEVDLLRRYIRIDTTKDTGDELEAVRFLAAELARSGIASTIEELPGRRASLWALVRATIRRRGPAVRRHRPGARRGRLAVSALVRRDQGPWLFGRGSFDMKSVGVAQLVALRRLVESGRPLRRSVLFLATSSEEHGSDYGLRWLLVAHPELVSRFGVFLTEGGAVEARRRKTSSTGARNGAAPLRHRRCAPRAGNDWITCARIALMKPRFPAQCGGFS
jgi:hypothetical protein